MCTVTYIPSDNGFYLTSNRDEKIARGQSWVPEEFKIGDSTLLYPKDPLKNGTWIMAKNNGDGVVLLNGAFLKHCPKEEYKKSRGVVLLEIMESEKPDKFFQEINLENIEPFTLVLFTSGNLWECRWDGTRKYFQLLDKSKEYIWSSSTLYDKMAVAKRNSWFQDWWDSGGPRDSRDILNFHRTAGKGDLKDGLVMNREGKLKTLSITQIQMNKDKVSMVYLDLEYHKQIQKEMEIKRWKIEYKSGYRKELIWKVQSLWIRLFHWEYWPFNLVYSPIIAYWLWLGIKSRSFFFFNTANPSIENGGFAMESKWDIHQLIPRAYCPKTVFIDNHEEPDRIIEKLKEQNLNFPIIVKPNIGYRGILVKKVQNEKELIDYAQDLRVSFLLQEFIPYKNEVGIFYYRIPGESKGHISGIVGKDFLTLVGDNRSTIRELILKEPRFLLQWSILRFSHEDILDQVLKEGQMEVLVPYGNHARGVKFVDLSHLISEELTQRIDQICHQVPEFYFGRLDIMYNSWEELCKGKNFSIVELNGAGSEPTHIYDPKHSIFFAWKEIIRHWKILNQVSILNKERKGLEFLSMEQGLSLLKNNSEYLKLVS